MTNSTIPYYKEATRKADEQITFYTQRVKQISLIRFVLFLIALPLFYFLSKTDISTFSIGFIILGILFTWAVLQQQKNERQKQRNETLKMLSLNEISCIENHRNAFYNGQKFNDDKHNYEGDLDVFGSNSIYALINRCTTYYGNEHLKAYFSKLPENEMLEERTRAVQELEGKQEFCLNLYCNLWSNKPEHDLKIHERIQESLDLDLSFSNKKWMRMYIAVLPYIWMSMGALVVFKAPFIETIIYTILGINIFLVLSYSKQVNKVQSFLSLSNQNLSRYITTIQHIFSQNWQSSYLQKSKSKIATTKGEMPVQMLSDLKNIIDLLDYRLNLLVAIVLNGLLLWDLRIINRLSDWKEKNYRNISTLFEHIGEIEALSSLSTWAFNHPEYTYPTIHNSYLEFSGESMMHPLILNDGIPNDFQIDKEHKVSIITGSNMSGKSTFLRTIGLNMILAYTGTKVAAKFFKTPLLHIITYMRIKDALEENVSTFKAELNRVSMILNEIQKDQKTLVLVDEMLRGTNSKDKLKGSMSITQKLNHSNAYALVATHDIKLAEMGEKDPSITNYYFDIDYENGELVFDYKIKDGICENFNASFLLSQLGLNME